MAEDCDENNQIENQQHEEYFPQPVPPPIPQYYFVTMPAPEQNGAAVASLVLGIISIFASSCYGIVGLIVSIVGLIFAGVAKKKQGGNGMRVGGLVTSLIGLVISLIVIALIVIAFWISFKNMNNLPYNYY